MENKDNEFLLRFEKVEKEFDELDELLCSVEIISDNKLYNFYRKKINKIEGFAKFFKEYKKILSQIEDNKILLESESDVSFVAEIKRDIDVLENQKVLQFAELKTKYKNLEKTQFQKVRVELSFKQGDKENLNTLNNMLNSFAEKYGHKISFQKKTETGSVIEIFGEDVFNDLSIFNGNSKFILCGCESVFGISVIIFEDSNFELDPDDVIVETLKSGGAGGQHINKTESAIRLVHKPTGIIAICQDERSQFKNKERAFENLKNKLNGYYSKKQLKDIEFQRKNIKNALFSSTPMTIFDFDKNIFYCNKTNQNYKLKQILDGEIKIVSRDVMSDEK